MNKSPVIMILTLWLGGRAMSYGNDAMKAHYLSAFQYADIAGLGSVVGTGDNSVDINVHKFWFGNYPTNQITISGAFDAFDDWSDGAPPEGYFHGKFLVFFAVTNEWKTTSPARSMSDGVVLDSSVAVASVGSACPPRFVMSDPPTWFLLATNDVEHITFYSNIVTSIVAARDRELLYTTLRDIIKSDDSVEQPYRVMSYPPMWDILWTADEEELERALKDTLLARRLRRRALSHLKTKFGWPEDSEVPDP